MGMLQKYGAGPDQIDAMNTDRLRENFMVEGMFAPGKIGFAYTHFDRMIVGGAVPTDAPLSFGGGEDVGTETFFEAREMGIANLGGAGWIEVDGTRYDLGNRDVLYIGRGNKTVTMQSDDAENPAWFYMNSVPAGADISTRLITRSEAKVLKMGDAEKGNLRSLAMYIHPEVSPSCLLLMGITDPAKGSMWNTMPPHLHERRMEAYCYFDMSPEDRVMHFMGRPDNTRHLVVGAGDIVMSPAWSIHMGAGTGPYGFVWGMTGENQAYTDVDPVKISELR
ncbi:5-dehydro-4-deoxy-D-glucuronate isomerase [Pseudosulfitobacter pseudonitzschiae]|uniref:5-dehydro-4-deoxy-D-glucuronate isomerase n=1 Tax=Pseudosulfitobacter pseudonitzschiae TaxID=1402135 RepID=UPI001CCFB794|nr:5-dehydro-4-deoxy-D-glucuronate isomerase [Pseudosulfitobacter pseudonitzschiae]MBM1817335.1 5-dehydro-4-deoxy-D-glucuronate isomerase [Pseudosulfitobacter pseudonitzschiae]MBM1834346.1 5-dehydro-4-deoxy-D-glucuronate isomerase [Pseudosulfitobacter pseudonitzschiae]MBM1839211.1 5-dehydro-4-deoxy-D-glucuronate isomerase [Pseudosulfitobacter pseudonitzschiae]MBM1844061.1 5-dehydro-4-deoxy-D-glucuronate isomerase [Pseudosulfitobacter pseudonitzschiae]MBM1848896.1 5-dehydro-4-deoxy-D-glucuronat